MPGSILRATLYIEQLDPATFDGVVLTGAQTFAALVPEPATWTSLVAGLLALLAAPGKRARFSRRAQRAA